MAEEFKKSGKSLLSDVLSQEEKNDHLKLFTDVKYFRSDTS